MVCVCVVSGQLHCFVHLRLSVVTELSELTERLNPLLVDALTLHGLSAHTHVPELSVQPWDQRSSISVSFEEAENPSCFNMYMLY